MEIKFKDRKQEKISPEYCHHLDTIKAIINDKEYKIKVNTTYMYYFGQVKDTDWKLDSIELSNVDISDEDKETLADKIKSEYIADEYIISEDYKII